MRPDWIEKRRQQASSQVPLVGKWIRRQAAQALIKENSPAAVALLCELAASSPDDSLRSLVFEALHQVQDRSCIDQICAIWERLRHPQLAALLAERQWTATEPPRLKVLTALAIQSLDAALAGGAEAVPPLLQACEDADPAIAQRARDALRQLRHPLAIATFCDLWAETRNELLTEFLLQANYLPVQPGRVRVLCALKTGRWDVLIHAGAELVQPLLEACHDADPELRTRARQALAQLASPQAQDMLCRLVLESDAKAARDIAVRAGFVPIDSVARALFFFLTEQWEAFQNLDFDQRLLAAAYETGSRKLRSRIAEKARRAGRAEWAAMLAGSRENRRLQDMIDEEWEAVIDVLRESGRWDEAWRLAQAAPAQWSAPLLQSLGRAGWKPGREREAEGLAALLDLAGHCKEPLPFFANAPSQPLMLAGHSAPVVAAVVSRDGRTLLSASQDQTLKLWDLCSGALLNTWTGHNGRITGLAKSPQERFVASADQHGNVRVWSLPEGAHAAAFRAHPDEIHSLAFSPDGTWLATASAEEGLRLWDWAKGTLWLASHRQGEAVTCLALSGDGRYLACGSSNGQVAVWSLPEGLPVAERAVHRTQVNCLAFARDHHTLVSASRDGTLALWDLRSDSPVHKLEGHRDEVTCLALSPNGATLASGSRDTSVRLWDLGQRELAATLSATGQPGQRAEAVHCLSFSPDGSLLAAGGADGMLRLWTHPGGAPRLILEGHQGCIHCVTFSPGGQMLISGGEDNRIGCWQSDLARLRRLPASHILAGHLEWLEQASEHSRPSQAERGWIEFMLGLARWRRRHDIQVDEPVRLVVGNLDIEIEG